MCLAVVHGTKPTDVKRKGIVVVVSVNFYRTANLAHRPFDFSCLDSIVEYLLGVVPSIMLRSVLRGFFCLVSY